MNPEFINRQVLRRANHIFRDENVSRDEVERMMREMYNLGIQHAQQKMFSAASRLRDELEVSTFDL